MESVINVIMEKSQGASQKNEWAFHWLWKVFPEKMVFELDVENDQEIVQQRWQWWERICQVEGRACVESQRWVLKIT